MSRMPPWLPSAANAGLAPHTTQRQRLAPQPRCPRVPLLPFHLIHDHCRQGRRLGTGSGQARKAVHAAGIRTAPGAWAAGRGSRGRSAGGARRGGRPASSGRRSRGHCDRETPRQGAAGHRHANTHRGCCSRRWWPCTARSAGTQGPSCGPTSAPTAQQIG